uniref:Olduvai domain-containing protein n=1 Tax=Nomascus leucogenys TaxID=61853 RepID=A0A2I3HH74_NOMLE
MVVPASPWSSEKAKKSILEINEKLHPQLAENKQQFRNSKEKFLVTQVAYFLVNQQNKYHKFYRLTITKCQDLIKSMLRNELQFKEEKLAEQLRQLTQLREKLQERRDASCLLSQHLQALLTLDEPDNSQGQDLQEQPAEGCRLAQHFVQKLSSENDEDEDEDVEVEEAEKVQESCAPREVQKAEGKEVPEDSLEECAVTYSNSYGPCDSKQPHRNTKITFKEEKDAVHIIPENESDDEEEEEKGPVSPR